MLIPDKNEIGIWIDLLSILKDIVTARGEIWSHLASWQSLWDRVFTCPSSIVLRLCDCFKYSGHLYYGPGKNNFPGKMRSQPPMFLILDTKAQKSTGYKPLCLEWSWQEQPWVVMLELSSVIGYRICQSTALWGSLLPDQVRSEKRFFPPKKVETLFTWLQMGLGKQTRERARSEWLAPQRCSHNRNII